MKKRRKGREAGIFGPRVASLGTVVWSRTGLDPGDIISGRIN